MVQTSNVVVKRQKTEDVMESVMFNSDSLFKIASYLPADGLINLALTCRRFGVAPDSDGDCYLSLVEETARRIVHDIATDEQKNALPRYDEDNWLSKYNYLQSLRAPLTFDQLAGNIVYVEGNKTRVVSTPIPIPPSPWGRRRGQVSNIIGWGTAFSNNIMMAGKHYASFQVDEEIGPGSSVYVGVMRPGEAMQSAKGEPLEPEFFNHFTQREGSQQYNNNVNCCMYDKDGYCCSTDWDGNFDREDWDGNFDREEWEGMEEMSSPCTIGMLLDLDEGTLSVYKNGRRLGVMKRGLAGQYCWVVSLVTGNQVTIKRGTVPENRGDLRSEGAYFAHVALKQLNQHTPLNSDTK